MAKKNSKAPLKAPSKAPSKAPFRGQNDSLIHAFILRLDGCPSEEEARNELSEFVSQFKINGHDLISLELIIDEVFQEGRPLPVSLAPIVS